VSLRPWRETDVPAKLMAFGDPVVQRFSWSRAAPYTEADARGYFVEQERARLRGEALHFALVEPANDDVVLGGGSLYDVDLEQSRAALGYWLAPATSDMAPRQRADRPALGDSSQRGAAGGGGRTGPQFAVSPPQGLRQVDGQ